LKKKHRRETSGKKERNVLINECDVPIFRGDPFFGLSMPWYATYCTEIRERRRENVNERLESDKKIKRYFISTLLGKW